MVPWLILLLPLAAALAILLGLHRKPSLSALLSTGAVTVSFLLGLTLFLDQEEIAHAVPWIHVGTLHIDIGYRIDPLSLLMVLVVTGVGGLIHWYSRGYMKDDPGQGRYFGCLSLFSFSMLGIVLADNLMQIFLFWELVGLSSYLLIGFWFRRGAAADASMKAFLTNRLGDFGFLIGILMVQGIHGTLSLSALRDADSANTAIALLVLCGAIGKSAQFPLHVWLPDAMEGPTPVSALIHAATMVAAGVYLLCRLSFLFPPEALIVVAWIGGITALMAALMALGQNDIKRILACSTLSQLGYMVMAVGAGAPHAAMFHLTTHACFKALLFLGAGSVITALGHQQDIWRMGGLHRRMPVTGWTFLVGLLALCGLPGLSGFFSKESVLASTLESPLASGSLLFGLGIVVAALTTLYMLRLYLVAFLGEARSEAAAEATESPATMCLPLVLLAAASCLAGYLPIQSWISSEGAHLGHDYWLLTLLFSMLALGFGLSVALAHYRHAASDPLAGGLPSLSLLLRRGFFLDALYRNLIDLTHETLSRIADFLDRRLIDGLAVRGLTGLTDLSGRALRLLQTGHLQTYALLLLLGTALLLCLIIGRQVFPAPAP